MRGAASEPGLICPVISSKLLGQLISFWAYMMHAADYFESLGISPCARDAGKTKSLIYTQCSTDHGQW